MSAATTMRALVLRQHGGLDQLEVVTQYPVPSATEGHVVIRVGASSFNYHDVFTVRGMPGIKVPLPVIIGLDMAGEVVEPGPGVTGWQPGDRVLVNPVHPQKGLMGEMLDGGMAEYCRVAAEQLLRMPDSVTFEAAASLPVAYGTAHRMLITHKTVKQGDTVALVVTSDVADEIHLHGYDLKSNAGPGKTARIAFVAKIPGRFEIELEDHGVQIGDLEVEP